MKRPLLLLACAAVLGACASPDEAPPRVESARRAPVGIAYRVVDGKLTFTGSRSFEVQNTPADSPVPEGRVRSKAGRSTVETGEVAVFSVLAGDLVVVDHVNHSMPMDSIVRVRRSGETLDVMIQSGGDFPGAFFLAVREVGIPKREPLETYRGLEALFVMTAHVAKATEGFWR